MPIHLAATFNDIELARRICDRVGYRMSDIRSGASPIAQPSANYPLNLGEGFTVVNQLVQALALALAFEIRTSLENQVFVEIPRVGGSLASDLAAVDFETLGRLALAINIEIDRRKQQEGAR